MRSIIKFIKCILFAIFSTLLFPSLAMADTYSGDVTWQDNTPTGSQYTPTYNVEWRINGGAVTAASNLPAHSYNWSFSTAPGDTVEVRVQNKNSQGNLVSSWSPWVQALAPVPPTVPSDPSGISFTVSRTGP
jgi:hypothetical protein